MKRLTLLFIMIISVCGMYAQTISELKAKAEQGDVKAMMDLAGKYEEIEDKENALFWIEKAADAGDAEANYMYGTYLFYNKESDKAISHITRAAEGNLFEAQYLLGTFYAADTDSLRKYCPTISRDLDKAEKWLLKCLSASEEEWITNDLKKKLGDVYMEKENYAAALKLYREVEAGNELGWMYENGFGVTKDTRKAAEYYRTAAEKGDEEANDRLEKLTGENIIAQQTEKAKEESLATELNNKGIEYYNAQNYTEAVKYYRQAANMGNMYAQFNLGYCYYNGLGVEQDYTEAVKLFRKAANMGDMVAQNNLGSCYYNGQGVEQDYTEAVKLFRKAANMGDMVAQDNLGVCYYNGQGVIQHYAFAVDWFRKAAEQGYVNAQRNLGLCYENGFGVERNYDEALKWYEKAAAQGNEDAKTRIAEWTNKQMPVSESDELNDRGIEYYNEQNYTEAVKYYRQAADMGDMYAQYNLGLCYENGLGVAKNYNEAQKWYVKAAIQGNIAAQYWMGHMNQNAGEETTSVMWYEYAAAQGNEEAKLRITELEPKILAERQRWDAKDKELKAKAEQGDAYSQWSLAGDYMRHYYYSDIEKDSIESMKWYIKAAEQNYIYAQQDIAELFYKRKDYAGAAEWYKKVAEQNNEEAIERLGDIYYYQLNDKAEALKWYGKLAKVYEKYAKQDDVEACFQLGDLYSDDGLSEMINYKEALKWYEKARALILDDEYEYADEYDVIALDEDIALLKKMIKDGK